MPLGINGTDTANWECGTHRPSTGRGACPARGQYPPVRRRAPRLKREIVQKRFPLLNKIFPRRATNTNPAPGYRDAGNNDAFGILSSVGNYGSSYSSSISGSKGVYLDFSAPNLRIGYASSRGHGIQLRCLSE